MITGHFYCISDLKILIEVCSIKTCFKDGHGARLVCQWDDISLAIQIVDHLSHKMQSPNFFFELLECPFEY